MLSLRDVLRWSDAGAAGGSQLGAIASRISSSAEELAGVLVREWIGNVARESESAIANPANVRVTAQAAQA